jgi:uridylate kinase
VLLKMSGEALMGPQGFGLHAESLHRLAREVREAWDLGIELSLVVGAGNVVRGSVLTREANIERATADSMGMLATVINALAVQGVLEKAGLDTRVMSAIPMTTVCEPYIRRRAIRHMEKGRIVIFAAGTGNPFFTTDTAAALRAAEMGCDALLKGTQVDGVYSSDPKKDPHAERYERLSYRDVLSNDLRVMDTSAISLARDSRIPIIVFSIHDAGAFARVLGGAGPHTIITEEAAE